MFIKQQKESTIHKLFTLFIWTQIDEQFLYILS